MLKDRPLKSWKEKRKKRKTKKLAGAIIKLSSRGGWGWWGYQPVCKELNQRRFKMSLSHSE